MLIWILIFEYIYEFEVIIYRFANIESMQMVVNYNDLKD